VVTSPIKLNTSVPLGGADIEYLPFASERTPIAVPFTRTVTPGIGVPSSEFVTVPVIEIFWAHNQFAMNSKHNRTSSFFFIGTKF
jgi:hypothetical protein